MSISKIAKVVAFGEWDPQPSAVVIEKKSVEIESFFVASLVAIHALANSSKSSVVEMIFGGDELAFKQALIKIAEIQLKDELDEDESLPEAIRVKAFEIGEVERVGDDEYFECKAVREELRGLISALFDGGPEGDLLDELAADFSGAMGDYFDKVCFSPGMIYEAYVKRMDSLEE